MWVQPVELTTRVLHHQHQIMPFVTEPIMTEVLAAWWNRTAHVQGRSTYVVHGDPTLENYMLDGVWLDPSIRSMPLECELDGGKLLQSYFGYHGPLFGKEQDRELIRKFLHEQKLDVDLCIYYMVTHVIRLYRIQEHARPWAIDLLTNLDERVKELRCK